MNIIEVELLSDDLSATEKFYKKVLGLSALSSGKEVLYFQIGYTKLIFRKSENMHPVYHFAIDVPNNRFTEALRFVKDKTAIIPVGAQETADFTNWNAESFYFFDNNGNILECITRYPNKTYSTEPFSSKSFISVNEIGLVSNNVPALADLLYKTEGIPIYTRQPRSDNFTVSGNDEGLFIIASKGRDWYPTHIKSQSFRTRIIFMHQGIIGHIVR
jgi:catechol 2,3-dioxygenase-like lactoylglutathione lyase family enzyme